MVTSFGSNETTQQKINDLGKALKLSNSQIIREAIDLYYQTNMPTAQTADLEPKEADQATGIF